MHQTFIARNKTYGFIVICLNLSNINKKALKASFKITYLMVITY